MDANVKGNFMENQWIPMDSAAICVILDRICAWEHAAAQICAQLCVTVYNFQSKPLGIQLYHRKRYGEK